MPRALAVLIAAVVVLCVLALPSVAAMSRSTSATTTLSTARLAAPTGLTATCGRQGNRTWADLSWNVAALASGYQILRSQTSGGPYSVVQSVGSVTTVRDTPLNRNQTYYYVARATRSNWSSANSTQVSLVTNC